ncbi:hypothetical protein LJC34_06450 [Oscillospiraceae bacterium OttesenSCG-928-G22]|nr:hypothetical protein [Oscillospiraceae bacterium OttesenSCG-928-G22]
MHRTEPLPGSTYEVNILTADETSEEIILSVNLSTDKKKAPAEKLALRQKSSINRAIHTLLDICENNHFDYSASLSLLASLDVGAVRKKIGTWIKNYNKSRKTHLQYVLVIAQYEKGGYHCHMLLSGILPKDLILYSPATAKTGDMKSRVEIGERLYDWRFRVNGGKEHDIGIWCVKKIDSEITQQNAAGYLAGNLNEWKSLIYKYEDRIKAAGTQEEKDGLILEAAAEIPSDKNIFSASAGLTRSKVAAKRKAKGSSIMELLTSASINVAYSGPLGFRVIIKDRAQIRRVAEWFNEADTEKACLGEKGRPYKPYINPDYQDWFDRLCCGSRGELPSDTNCEDSAICDAWHPQGNPLKEVLPA